jgi:hypothetical protein
MTQIIASALLEDQADCREALGIEDDLTDITTALAGKANTSHTQASSTITDFDTAVDTRADARIVAEIINYDVVDLVRDAGGVDGGSAATNNTAFTTALSLLSPTKGGKIVIPEGEFLMSGRTIDQPNVTIEGRGRGSILKNTAANQTIIKVGTSLVIDDRVVGFRCKGVTFNGGGFHDTSNDFPLLFCRYVDDAIISDCYAHDGGSWLRFGRGELAWTTIEQQSKYVRAYGNHCYNMEYFNIELHGAYDAVISGNVIEGGSTSDTVESLGIRLVKTHKAVVSGNIVNKCGRGIATSADDANQQVNLHICDNIVSNGQYGLPFSAYGQVHGLTVSNNQFIGASTELFYMAYFNNNGFGTIEDVIFEGNYCEVDSAEVTAIVRLDGIKRASIKNNILKNIDNAPTNNNYAIQLVGCDDIIDVRGNVITMDANNSRGIWDVSGLATEEVIVQDNALKMAAAARTNAIASSASSGTRYVRDNRILGVADFQTLATNTDFTLTPYVSPRLTYHTGTLTANRTVTLDTTNVQNGHIFEIRRTGGGAFTLNVGSGPLKAMPTSSWAVFEYSGGWLMTKYGTL